MSRTRYNIPQTIYVDYVGGNNSNSGSATAPYKNLQCALDHASADFDFDAPFTWAEVGNYGYRPGVTIQIADVSAANAERLTVPLLLDGHGQMAPITLRGNNMTPTNVNIYAANSLQGITSQNGGEINCEGFALRGDQYCTLFNTLALGKMSVKNVYVGQGATGDCAVLGAAGGSQLDVTGTIYLMGSGFGCIANAIEDARLIFAPAANFNFTNAMHWDVFLNLNRASCWTQGSPPTIGGSKTPNGGAAVAYAVNWQSFCGISNTASVLPGNPGNHDSTSIVL